MIGRSMHAELFALRRRPAVWALAGVWAGQLLIFAYLIAYIIYRTMDLGDGARALLTNLLPVSLDHYIVGSMPIWGGPVMLIIGGLIAAGDYRWGTLRVVAARFANRTALLLGRYLALALVMLGIAIGSLIVGALSSTVVALVQHESMDWPGVGDLLLAVVVLWFVSTAWASVGFALGVLTRNIAATIGIGLLWTLAVENIAGALAGALGFDGVRSALLGPSSAAMAQALGAQPGADGGFAVTAVSSPAVAVAVLAAYAVAGLAVALLIFHRRDIT